MAGGRLRGAGSWRGVRVLGYHRVSTDPGDLSVHPDRFAAQMEALARRDVTVVPLDEGLARLASGDVEERLVCITFDDGYRDFIEHAKPVLDRHGFAATIYVPTAIIDREASFYWFSAPPAALTWDELRELEASGLVDVQPHSRTHPWLPSLADGDAKDEIEGSTADVGRRLGKRATSFCFPAGLAGPREVELVKRAGLRAAVTTDPGVNTRASDLDWLKRTLLFWGDDDELAAAKLDGLLDRPSLGYRMTQRRRRSMTAPGYAR